MKYAIEWLNPGTEEVKLIAIFFNEHRAMDYLEYLENSLPRYVENNYSMTVLTEQNTVEQKSTNIVYRWNSSIGKDEIVAKFVNEYDASIYCLESR